MTREMFLIFLSASLPTFGATTRIANTRPAEGVEVSVASVKPVATGVTMKLERATASEMFDRLARQAGTVIDVRDPSVWDDPAIAGAVFSSEWDRAPLWEAIREACEAAEVRFEVDGSEPGVPRILLSRGKSLAPSWIDGPAVFRAEKITRTAGIGFADESRSGEMVKLSIRVTLEPALVRHRAALGMVTIEAAHDERGRSLASTQPADRDPAAQTLPDEPLLSIPLDYPADAPRKLALLRGSVTVTVAGEVATISFVPPFERFKDARIPVGGNLLIVRAIEVAADGSCRVELTMTRGQNESVEAWAVASKAFGHSRANAALLSANGPFPSSGGSASWGDKEARVEMHYPPRSDSAPATVFRVEIPIAFERLNPKFELKDIPLP